jgi:alpha-methylacyl-CoA racemase
MMSRMQNKGTGPLAGIKVVEMAGIGPGPFGTMLLGDLGAQIIRVERKGAGGTGPASDRNRVAISVDLKTDAGRDAVLDLIASADILVEGFRPGVMEKLGLGPDVCLARNPGLVYGRMTGWGQEGPLAPRAGHDIDYIAIAGVLGHVGREGEPPTPPINLVGDFGGGGMFFVVGVLAALHERSVSGRGQVVDVAMVDGAALLMSMIRDFQAMGAWTDERGTNVLDSGAPYYDVYETSDGQYMAVGAIEAQFYAALLDGLGLDAASLPDQNDRAGWPQLRETFTTAFRSRTRDEWNKIFENTDACVSPVITMTEATSHPHNVARNSFVEVDGMMQVAPGPRFSRTPGVSPRPITREVVDIDSALADYGVDADRLAAWRADGVIG